MSCERGQKRVSGEDGGGAVVHGHVIITLSESRRPAAFSFACRGPSFDPNAFDESVASTV